MASQYQDLADEALFELYRNGQSEAFDYYYQKVSPKIWGFIKKRVESTALAEDVFQEVWAKIHRSREQYDPVYPLNPWIFTIARSVLYDRLRSVQVNREDLFEEEALNLKYDQESLRTTVMPHAHSRDMDSLLEGLSLEQKEMIDLRYLKEWSFEEIAQSLGLSESSVRQRLSRIIRALRRKVV